MTKQRIPVPPDLAARMLFASDYTCCVCRTRGRSVQVHHIDENPSNNDPSNLAILCLQCHDETQTRGGFGRKLDSKLIEEYKADWCNRVVARRERADEMAAMRMAGDSEEIPTASEAYSIPADEALVAYVKSLPMILSKANKASEPLWDSGVTTNMMQGAYDVIDVVGQILVRLSSWFPENHFNERPAQEYFSDFISSRFTWHGALAEPDGAGTGGTIVGPTAAVGVLADVERAVEEVVAALLLYTEGFDFLAWQRRWRNAGGLRNDKQ